MHPKVREASGHAGNFNDPMIDCKQCKNRFRADKIVEEKLAKMIEKEGEEEVRSHIQKQFQIENLIPDARSPDQLKAFIHGNGMRCSHCGKQDRTEVRKFNMMFSTMQGVTDDVANKIWLRPETAQGIFVNFKNICDTTRMRVPFGIAQIGKAFRNEITPGNFLYRTREFEQMEIEYFTEDDEAKALEKFEERKNDSQKRRLETIGIKKENIRFREHEHDELSHYSSRTIDIEYKFPRGR